MRPLRLLFSLAFCVLSVIILLYLTTGSTKRQPGEKKSGIRTLFSFHTPLFPPSAIISLTDDNSTFFLSRPAAFGPLLPSKGLSGQLWIGSGFGEDHLARGSLGGANSEGELGCSDVPGWDSSVGRVGSLLLDGNRQKYSSSDSQDDAEMDDDPRRRRRRRRRRSRRRDSSSEDSTDGELALLKPIDDDDGTDDYLHRTDTYSDSTTSGKGYDVATFNRHADIQSLQESAEIAGNIVLLSRGGCGFLEKVKWAQRRGGVALIVGDDVRGGPLVTMYAKGDTSNVTIPALFTSHTTAHLLSSLMPSGGRSLEIPSVFADTLGSKNGKSTSKDTEKDSQKTTKDGEVDSSSGSHEKTASSKSENEKSKSDGLSSSESRRGWFKSFLYFLGFGQSDHLSVSTRPPSSGRHEWVQVEDWQEDRDKMSAKDSQSANSLPTTDDFVIGVHDWRDPDLIKRPSEPTKDQKKKTTTKSGKRTTTKDDKIKGGSIITPGSGEYEPPTTVNEDSSRSSTKKGKLGSAGDSSSSRKGWLGRSKDKLSSSTTASGSHKYSKGAKSHGSGIQDGTPDQAHEGLWVTLTPTNMSSSPFLDTILVLVVSPLVTLTVVYALLLLRSRIRRRRWRAPKSVVDRLPIRVYHTLSRDSSCSVLTTPISSSPTTPLLQSSNTRRVLTRTQSSSRPRSRTTSEVLDQAASSSSPLSDQTDAVSLTESEKREQGLAEWRRRYGGRQRECVVCLEEYVDGVSRVMSLPCGHEFHAECITPWLTTRRRTCPICKGDVVRSMARSTATSTGPMILSRQNSYGRQFDDDDDDDDVQNQLIIRRNDSPSAQDPVPMEDDVERGDEWGRRPDLNRSIDGWIDWGSNVLGVVRERFRPPTAIDRDR